MKFLFASVFVAFIAASAGQGKIWEAYKQVHGKTYDETTDNLRQQIFAIRTKEIALHNSNPSNTFQQGHNYFSDMTDSERQNYLGGKPLTLKLLADDSMSVWIENPVAAAALPVTLDYRNSSCLGAIKKQGKCGSCWAFSAIAALEFAYCIKHQNISIMLSEQQLLDCETVDSACNGGYYFTAWDYLKKGSAKSALYPYNAVKGTKCKYTNATMLGAQVSSYGYIGSTKNNASQQAVAMQTALQQYGVISVAILVTSPFYSYKSGVYNDKTCDATNRDANHAVNVVGWGALNGVNYWVVRNSWGTTWGMKGYILMQRGVNKCKIETYPYYVVAY